MSAVLWLAYGFAFAVFFAVVWHEAGQADRREDELEKRRRDWRQ